MRELLKRITPKFLIRVRQYFENLYYFYPSDFAPVAKELSKETGIPHWVLWLDMFLSFLRHIIVPQEYKMYRFYERSRWARAWFLSRCRNDAICALFNPQQYRALFDNKNEFNRYFSEFIRREWLYAPDASDQQIEDFLRTQEQIIVKPHDASYGIGVHKALYAEVTDMRAFCESARKERSLLEEIVKQHADLGSINPTSVNTIRINTVVDQEGVPHVLCAALRIGRGESIADNLHSGGIGARIDLDSGVLFTLAVGNDLQTHVKHPISGVILPGFQIPHWEAAKEMVLCAAKMIPQTRWIGWDVAITETGPLLIEGNRQSNTDILQLPAQTGVYHILRRYV